jgi:hypothetical protein
MTVDPDTSSRISDRLVRRAALGMTRRRLLRNASAAALAFSLGGAFAGIRLAEPARASGTPRHPCGTSPLCPKRRCYRGRCSNAAGQGHGDGKCRPNHGGGYWYEDYRNIGKGRWRCVDCCALDGGGKLCTRCGNDTRRRRRCICRKKVG